MALCAAVFLSSGILALAFTPLARLVAVRLGIYDRPDGPLKDHGRPVPYLGGLALYGAAALGMVAGVVLVRDAGVPREMLWPVLLGATAMAVVGLVDDLRPLPSWAKLLCQAVVATAVVGLGVRLTVVVMPDWLCIVLSVLWLLVTMNAFNIIDVMDGAAAGVAGIAAIGLGIIALGAGQVAVAAVAAALAGACAGFLRYNFHPASIFMGDAGSGMLGLVVGALAMAVSYTTRNSLGLLAPLLILGIPLYDMGLVVILRLRRGRAVFRGSRDHLALRLVALGLDERRAALGLYVVAALLAAAAMVLVRASLGRAVGICGATAGAAAWAGWRLSRVDMETSGESDGSD